MNKLIESLIVTIGIGIALVLLLFWVSLLLVFGYLYIKLLITKPYIIVPITAFIAVWAYTYKGSNVLEQEDTDSRGNH